MAKVHIGLSGYSYKPWQGEDRFYPAEIKQKDFLGYYSTRYDAVEMDGTWYRMPSVDGVQTWLETSPTPFSFCFKLHRNITHVARLKLDGIDSLKFMLGRLLPLARAGKLGPLLVQLPPNMKRADDRLEAFFSGMPKKLPIEPDGGEEIPLRYAIEFRHDSWHDPVVEEILRRHGVAWVAADTDDDDAQRRDTASFHYARLRKSDYSEAQLEEWARYFCAARATGKDCFVFCKHEDDGSPWIWADCLLRNV